MLLVGILFLAYSAFVALVTYAHLTVVMSALLVGLVCIVLDWLVRSGDLPKD